MFGFSTFSQTPFCSLPTTGISYSAIVQENIGLVDSIQATAFLEGFVSESLIFNDVATNSLDFVNSVQELIEISDPLVSPFVSVNSLINESTEFSSQVSQTLTISFFINENVQASAVTSSSIDFPAVVQEFGVTRDSAFARLLWELINDSQTQSWQNFGTDSNPVWALIISDSTSAWGAINSNSTGGWSLVGTSNPNVWGPESVHGAPNWGLTGNNQTQSWQNFGTDSNPVWGVVVSDGSSSWVVIFANNQNGWPVQNNADDPAWNVIKTLN